MLNISMFASPVPFPLSLHLPFPWLFTALSCIFHLPYMHPLQLYFFFLLFDICHLSFPLFVGGQWLLGGISHLKRWSEGWEQEAWDPDWHSLAFGVALLSSPLLLHSPSLPPHLLCLSTHYLYFRSTFLSSISIGIYSSLLLSFSALSSPEYPLIFFPLSLSL